MATAGASCAAQRARASSGTNAEICRYAAAVMPARNFSMRSLNSGSRKAWWNSSRNPAGDSTAACEEAVDAGVGEPAGGLVDVGFQAGAHAIQDRLIQVGLGVEVPVEDHPGDAGLRGDVIQARRREPAARERFGRGGEDLLPALRAGQAA